MTHTTPDQDRRQFYARGGVVRIYPGATQDSGVAVAPSGAIIDTSSTLTAGIQEAWTYAIQNRCDFEVMGGNNVVYNLHTSLVILPMQGMRVTFGCVTLNFTNGVGSSPCIIFDSMMGVWMEIPQQIVNQGTGPGILFKAVNPVPTDLATVIVDSYFHIMCVANIHDPQSAVATVPAIKFDLSIGSVLNNTFHFDELLGNGIALLVANPAVDRVFRNNKIQCMDMHDNSSTTLSIVQLGTSAITSGQIVDNRWTLALRRANTSIGGLATWGSSDIFNLSVHDDIGGTSWAVTFNPGADYNQVYATRLMGSGAANNNLSINGGQTPGTTNNYHNRVVVQHTPSRIVITPGASPYAYLNNDFVEEEVIVHAGTVSEIALSGDGITYEATGLTAGSFHLQPGAYLKVTYSVTPTMAKIL